MRKLFAKSLESWHLLVATRDWSPHCFADFFIVLASFLEWLQFTIQSLSTLNPKILRLLRVFRAIRAVRALRVLRTISFLKNLQVIVGTLLSSIPALSNIILLLFLVLYVFAIMGSSWPEFVRVAVFFL